MTNTIAWRITRDYIHEADPDIESCASVSRGSFVAGMPLRFRVWVFDHTDFVAYSGQALNVQSAINVRDWANLSNTGDHADYYRNGWRCVDSDKRHTDEFKEVMLEGVV